MSSTFDFTTALGRSAALLALVTTAGCADLGGSGVPADTDDPATSASGSGAGSDGDTDEGDDTGDSDGEDTDDAPEPTFPDAQDGMQMSYRDDLGDHPGCSTAGLSYPAAEIPGYACAAKDYTGDEDTDKPIILLIHGNSDSPAGWEAFSAMGACEETRPGEGADMLAEILHDAGFKTLAVDFRYDLVDDPDTNNDTENAAKNMDHGWAVPIASHFIRSAIEANPDRRFVVMGFSFGVTTARDALRRLLVKDGFNAFDNLDQAIYMAGGNHGVSSFPLCGVNPTMRGTVTCEMGDRAAYSPTYFSEPLNGPGGDFESPCGDGEMAFGESVCDGTVQHTTIVMRDLDSGEQQDLFVSEASSRLEGADNRTIGLNDYDETNYFVCGLLRNHFGAARSEAALDIIREKLSID
jgi:hypothetical protein